MRFGIARLKRMRQPELASAFFVYIVCIVSNVLAGDGSAGEGDCAALYTQSVEACLTSVMQKVKLKRTVLFISVFIL